MIWLMEILKYQLEEQLLIKHCMIKHLIMLKILNMIDINADLLQWSINFLLKNSGGAIKNENIYNKELAEELHKPIIRAFEKLKVHSPFIEKYLGCRSC